MRYRFLVAVVVAELLPSSAALAQGPAVSGPNGKVEAGWFWQGSLGSPYLSGSYDVPLGQHFGFQVDALAGHVQGDGDYWGLGGQFFWRDPEIALIGIGASHLGYGAFRIERVQASTEVYLGDVTVSAQAARDFYNFSGFGLGHSDSADVSVGWYPNDDLLFQLGGSFGSFGNTATLHSEWQPDVGVSGLALTADLSRASGQTGVLFAVRYYFGGDDKTLKRRHREDDPPLSIPGMLGKDTSTLATIEQGLAGLGPVSTAAGRYQALVLFKEGTLDTAVSNCRQGIANSFLSSYAFSESAQERLGNIQICATVVDRPTMVEICTKEVQYTKQGDDTFIFFNRQAVKFCKAYPDNAEP